MLFYTYLIYCFLLLEKLIISPDDALFNVKHVAIISYAGYSLSFQLITASATGSQAAAVSRPWFKIVLRDRRESYH